ncbi:fasciclin domain-containing protein [Sphingomonadaceae bacterium jetA1]|uniref:fasciclin domain-containing protein n=1 Tax=Facivitalis istanbulensis TaxID=3075838 RepID=UPI00348034D3
MTAWKWTVAAIALASGLGLAACSSRNAEGNTAATTTQPNLKKALGAAAGLGAMAQMVKQAGLERTFDGAGSYTLFAPTDAAIAALPAAERQRLASAAGRPQLIALLRQHIAPGYVARADLDQGLARKGSVRVATVGSAPIIIHKQGEAIVLGAGSDAPKLTGDPIVASNGVIFPIDRVLPPPRR